MIDPNIGRAVESDSITAPNVLGVEIPDLEVLDNHVVGASSDTEAFAQNDTISPDPQNSLVARHHEGVPGCSVIGHLSLWCSFGAPVVRIDGQLTCGCSPVGSTSGLRGFAFGASEIESLGDDNVQRALLTKVVGQLSVGVWCDCWS